jgi:hypothetical protein
VCRWNHRRATAAVTRCGCRRGDSSRGVKRVAGTALVALPSASAGGGAGNARNAANLRVGSGMQQARTSRAWQTVEVVQDHEGGTCFPDGSGRPRGGDTPWTRRARVGGEAHGESHERRLRPHGARAGRNRARAEREAPKGRRRPRGRDRPGNRSARSASEHLEGRLGNEPTAGRERGRPTTRYDALRRVLRNGGP